MSGAPNLALRSIVVNKTTLAAAIVALAGLEASAQASDAIFIFQRLATPVPAEPMHADCDPADLGFSGVNQPRPVVVSNADRSCTHLLN